MSLRSRTAILAVAVGLSMAAAAQAAQVENGLTINGFATNGLTINGFATNGLTINGQEIRDALPEASSATIRLKAVILQDGTAVDLR